MTAAAVLPDRPAPLLAPPRPVPRRTPDEVRHIMERATAHLTPAEKVTAAELIARRIHAETRAVRYRTPGDLARVLDPTTVQTPALDLIDRRLCDAGDGRITRLGIFMPPQEGKSTRVAIFGVLWLLLRNPNLRIAIASYEQGLALRSGKAIRDYIEAAGSGTRRWPVPITQDRLSLSVSEDTSAMAEWSLEGHLGGVLSVGIGGGFTGRPADVLVIDDPVKDARAADSPLLRQRAWEWWTHVARVRLAPGGLVIVVQTRWHEDDLSGRLIAQDRTRPAEERQWTWVNIPAQAETLRPDDEQRGRLPDALGRPPGEFLLSARRRALSDWQDVRADIGARSWSALYQQHPTPSEGAVFRFVWFDRTRRGPDTELPRAVVRSVAVDTSAGGSDEAGIVAGFRGNDGRGYLTHDRSGNYTEAEWSRVAWLLAIDTDADRVVWEKNLAGPTMKRALLSAWALLQRQCRVLARWRAVDPFTLEQDTPEEAAALEIARANAGITVPLSQYEGREDQREGVSPEAVEEIRRQLEELSPDRVSKILRSPESGPASLVGVSATTGKRTRATPVAVAFETGRASLVGSFTDLEAQATSWLEGQDSPDRMDAMVWLFTDLLAAVPSGTIAPPVTTIPTGPITRSR
jgi:hypothetical protein